MLHFVTADYFWTTWLDDDNPDDGNGDTENQVQVVILLLTFKNVSDIFF